MTTTERSGGLTATMAQIWGYFLFNGTLLRTGMAYHTLAMSFPV